jgi:predicted kinase
LSRSRITGRKGWDDVTDELETAARYRLHAKELGILAADGTARDIKQPLLKLAEDYEHLADELEAIDQTNQMLNSSSATLASPQR